MELTPAETRLISSLRELDKQNPVGVDGFTESRYLEVFQRIAEGAIAEAQRRFTLFQREAAQGGTIDLAEARRSKARFEDIRATEKERAEYEQTYQTLKLPAPVWKKKAPPRPDRRQLKEAADAAKDEKTPVYLFTCGNAFVNGQSIVDFDSDAEAADYAADYEAICTRINPDGSTALIYEPASN